MARPELARIAERHNRTASQIIFRFALVAGMLPLTETTDTGHMRADLDVVNFIWTLKKCNRSSVWPHREAAL